MGVAHHVLALFTGDQEQLGVNFQPWRGEDDVYARFRQSARPVDVGLLVEASLELNHHGHFLAVVRRVDHRIDDTGIFRHAINVYFDRQHVRIERGLTQQFQHVFKGVIRIVEQHIPFADGVEPVAELIEPDMAQARQRFVHQIGLADVREANEIFKVVVTPTGDNGVVAGDGQLIAQHLHHRVRHIALIDKPHRLRRQALLEAGRHQLHHAGLHLMHQIVLGVTGHLHRVGVERVVIEEAFEDIVQAVAQDVIQQDHRLTPARGFRRQVYKAWDFIRRYFQQRVVNGLTTNDFYRQIGVIIFQELHQIGFTVDQNRGNVLAQIMFEIVAQPVLLIRGELAFVDQEDLVACHFQQQLVIEAIKFLIGFHDARLDFSKQMPRVGV
ncbi:Uncharacterised protein [Enterobacter cloacae]|nr:Uncharacterised protein [Enterobacter cloacae]